MDALISLCLKFTFHIGLREDLMALVQMANAVFVTERAMKENEFTNGLMTMSASIWAASRLI